MAFFGIFSGFLDKTIPNIWGNVWFSTNKLPIYTSHLSNWCFFCAPENNRFVLAVYPEYSDGISRFSIFHLIFGFGEEGDQKEFFLLGNIYT